MLFCNEAYCPTETNTRTACLPGQFGHITILVNNYKVTHAPNTPQNGIIGINQQCLLYYYYMPILPGTVGKITVRKEETSGKVTLLILSQIVHSVDGLNMDIAKETIATMTTTTLRTSTTSTTKKASTTARTSTVTGTSTATATESINSSTIKLATGLTTLSTTSIMTVVPIITSTKETNSSTTIITTLGQSTETSATTLPAIESTFSSTLTIMNLTTIVLHGQRTPQEITSIEVPRTSETAIKLTTTKTFSIVATNHTSLVSVTSSKITIAVPTKISTSTSRESTDLITTTTTAATRSSTTLIMNATTFGNNENNVDPSNKPFTSVLATLIPAICIAVAIVIFISKKRIASAAGSIFGSAAQYFMKKDQSIELLLIVEANPMKKLYSAALLGLKCGTLIFRTVRY
ncbi:unnamed protein product [Rotaria socialis]|uniref:Uncharacterized protein n=1 Tax=Rotaria socialis TaxID=392032 RepID=A0A821T362_9BILA|nr:unnamed protein product [Rotaria socialis]